MSARQIGLWVVLALLAYAFGGLFLVLVLLLAIIPALVTIKAASATDHVTRWMALAFASIIVFASFPALLVLLAAAIASLAGCPMVRADGQYHCVIGGADWGEALASMTLMVWAELFSLPVGGIALLIWAVIALNAYMKRRSPPQPGG